MHKQLNELRTLAAKAENRRTETGIPRVAIVQGQIPEHQLAAVYDPMVNLILTGSKTMTDGDRTFTMTRQPISSCPWIFRSSGPCILLRQANPIWPLA